MEHHHGNAYHTHATPPYRILILVIILIFGFAIVEAIAGWWANSLALLGDAGHMSSDAIALAIAAFAAWISQKPPSQKHSYGLGRAEVVAAWFSSLLMIVIALMVIIEAVHRIHAPPHVKGGVVMVTAFIGLLINILAAWLLAHGERTLNIRAALLHIMSDIIGSIAALVSGAVIYFTHWLLIDPILSTVIGLLIIFASLRLLRESLLILMEGVPGHINFTKVSAAMSKIEGIKAIHDLHIWTLSSGKVALSAHVDIDEINDWNDILGRLHILLEEQFAIHHVTLQPESNRIPCKPCQPTERSQ